MKKTVIAAVSAAFLIGATSAASAQICALGLIATAAIVGAQQKRELTTEEAMTCGLFAMTNKDAKAKAAKDKPAKKKTAGQSKPKAN